MLGRTTLIALVLPVAALAGPAWDAIGPAVLGDHQAEAAGNTVEIAAPYRTDTDSRTTLGASAQAPKGAAITALTLVLDENPMPVSAVVRFAEPQSQARFEATMRVNGPTPLHAVAHLTDGRALVAEAFVKTSGEGACAAPPGTDPVKALATLGEMDVTFPAMPIAAGATSAQKLSTLGRRALDVEISHPSLSGLQRDQITLLFIPMRYVSEVAVEVDGRPYARIEGSISLSENPRLQLSLPSGASEVSVTMTDTDGAVTTTTAHVSGT